MAFCASTPKVLICLQKYDLRIYVVSNPGQTRIADQDRHHTSDHDAADSDQAGFACFNLGSNQLAAAVASFGDSASGP